MLTNEHSGKFVYSELVINRSFRSVANAFGEKMKKRMVSSIVITVVVVIVVVSAFYYLYWSPFPERGFGGKPLELVASESDSSIPYGQTVNITIELYNTGPTSIFNVSDSWPAIDGKKIPLAISPCGSDWPYGFDLFSGYVTNETLATSKPLSTWEPGVYFCPLIFMVDRYQVNGSSDSGYLLHQEYQPVPITFHSDISISGYWSGNASTNVTDHFVRLPVGQYTVLVADEWGSTIFLHFRVS